MSRNRLPVTESNDVKYTKFEMSRAHAVLAMYWPIRTYQAFPGGALAADLITLSEPSSQGIAK